MSKKKWIAVLMGVTMMTQISVPVFAQTGTATYETYISGSETSRQNRTDYTIVEIGTQEELEQLAQNCQLDTWSSDKYIKLTADIVLQDTSNLIIPSFGGVFDGQGHTISNVRITTSGSNVGLFRYIRESGVVKNLKVAGRVVPDGTQSRVGGIAGVNYGQILLCSFTGNITGDSEIGGIAGVNEKSGEIRQCSSDAIVIGNHSVGGIAGNNHGTLNNCDNSGDVNTYGPEVSYEISDFTVDNLEEINSTDNVSAHTDSGGIAGISDGKIYYCSNSGTIGYSHVGYNTGGIVGRLHQGYVQNCTNTGHVLGRKDVGGIVGQMEPFLEVQYLQDKLQQFDREMDIFLDLLDATHKDLSQYGKEASSLTKSLTSSLKKASSAGQNLSQAGTDLWYIYNNELTGVNQDLKALNSEWKDLADRDLDSVSGNDSGDSNNPGNGKPFQGNHDWNIEDSISGGDWSGVKDDLSGAKDDVKDDLSDIKDDLPSDTESYLSALRKFGDNLSVHLDNVTKASNDRSGGINDNLKTLQNEMKASSDDLEKLSDVLEAGSDSASSHVDALVDQAKVLKNLLQEIRDDLFKYEGISIEDTSDESASKTQQQMGAGQGTAVGESPEEEGNTSRESTSDNIANESYYDTTAFQQGKLTLCVNKGQVEADSNVGGIAGQIATEYDFDPEDDVTLSGSESFDVEQTIKAVVRDSKNLGQIVGKKDYIGGVVGRAEYGAIISCESYGDISSSSGSFVGGIAGFSGYAIRSCYAMGNLTGKNQVGGIVGKGCDIFYSSAYTHGEVSGECYGAIAGDLAEDGTLYGNFYVPGEAGGVDGIGYSGGATPVDYETFCSMDGVPRAFSTFSVTFMADGEELASFQRSYGQSISEDEIPQIPQKDGYYAVWPEFDFSYITSNKVLEADYEPWITSLASKQKSEDGKNKVLVEGNFRPGDQLTVTEDGREFRIAIENEDKERYADEIEVRVLCEDTDKTKVEVKVDDEYKETDTTVMGSYLVFHMDEAGTFRLINHSKSGIWKWIAVGGAVIFVGTLLFLIQKRKKKSNQKKTSGKKKSSQAEESA